MSNDDDVWDELEEELGEPIPMEEALNRPPPPWWRRAKYKVERWWRKIELIPKRIKWFWQRGRRGWGDNDVWELYGHTTDVILGMLKEYRDHCHGTPVFYQKDENGEFKRDENGQLVPMDHEDNREKWDEELDKMIEAFEMVKKVSHGDWHFVPLDKWSEEDYESLKDIYGDEDWAHVMTKEETEYMREGMDLFMKRFFALWN